MKKLLSLVLCTVCLLCAVAFAGEDVSSIEADGIQYTLVDRDGETVAVVTGFYEDQVGDMLVIPMQIDGYPVVNIRLWTLGEQVTKVCTPDINFDIFTGNPTFTWIVYSTQAEAIEMGYEPVEGVADDELVMLSITECEYHALLDTMYISPLDASAFALPEELGIYAQAVPASQQTADDELASSNEQVADDSIERFDFEGVTILARLDDWGDGGGYTITGIEAPEDQHVLILPEMLNGKRVYEAALESLPAQIDTIYMPQDYSWYFGNGHAQYTWVRYAPFSWFTGNGWTTPADMTADDYGVVDIETLTLLNGNSSSATATVRAADLLSSIDGRRLLIPPSSNVLYESGVFTYTLEQYNDGAVAVIRSFTLAEGQDTLFIPPQIDGYPLHSNVWLDTFPEQLKTIYAPRNVSIRLENGSGTYTKVSYADYAYVQENKDTFKNILSEMTENDLALSSVNFWKVQSGSSSSNNTTIPADSLLTEIDGYRLLNGLHADYLSYMDGDIEYSFYNDQHTSVTVLSMPIAAEQTVLYIPSQLAGCIVQSADLRFAAGTSIDTVLHPDTAWVDCTEELPVLHLYRYYDKNVVNHYNYTGNHQYISLMNVDTPTIALTGYSRYEYGSSVDDATVEYYDVPTSFDGLTIVHMLDPDELTQYTHEDYSYINLPDGTIAITKYNNEFSKSVVVPSRLNGLTVTATFGGQYSDDAVFSGDELTSVELPATLKKIGPYTFYGWNINKITVPDGLVEISHNAFSYVSYKLNSLKLPEGLTTLGARWASGFGSKLKTVKLPSTVTELPAYSFAYSSFSELKLPDTITSIGNSAFEAISSLKTLTLPSTLTVIPSRMVAGSEKLAKITIPVDVVSIGNDAFAGCTKLATVTYKSKGALTTIGDGVFNGSGLKKFAPPEGVVTIGKNAAASCTSLTSVVLPNTVTSIGSYAFSGCDKLTKVTLSEGLTALPEGLFMGCKKLSAITIPASVTEIGEYVFEGCSAKLTITVTAGSFAEEWANANGYKVKVQKAK